MDSVNNIYISKRNHDFCFMFLQLLCQTKKYRILKIKVSNNHTLYLTTLRMNLHSKFCRITIFDKAVRHTQRRPFQHPFCVCADEHNICAVAVNGISMGKSCPHASGSLLLTNVDLLWESFFYFISFHYTGTKSLFMCLPIDFAFHPPPIRNCTVPFT